MRSAACWCRSREEAVQSQHRFPNRFSLDRHEVPIPCGIGKLQTVDQTFRQAHGQAAQAVSVPAALVPLASGQQKPGVAAQQTPARH